MRTLEDYENRIDHLNEKDTINHSLYLDLKERVQNLHGFYLITCINTYNRKGTLEESTIKGVLSNRKNEKGGKCGTKI